MAKGKGKGRSNNKKLNKGGGVNRRPTQSRNTSSSDPTYLKGEIPNFGQRSKANRQNFHTLYSRYKLATKRFVEYMRRHVPEELIEGEENQVIFLLAAADWMAATSFNINPCVVRDLKLSIRMRKRVAQSYFGGGDATHKYFIDILVYCWTMLRTLPTDVDGGALIEQDDQTEDNNQYNVLGEDNMEEDEDDEDMFPTKVPRPVPDKIRVTVEELMKSDDRNDAIFFLITLDELMGMVSNQYQALYKNIKNNRHMAYPESGIMEELLEAAVTSNFAIQQVQQLEMELQAQHKHLTTPYRLLSTLVLPNITSEVNETLQKHADGSKRWENHDVSSFLGDCMECYFQNPSDDWNRSGTIVKDFCDEYGVNEQGRNHLDKIFGGLRYVVVNEVPLKQEANDPARLQMLTRLESIGQANSSHSWLPRDEFIGGDRSIIHTIRLLQLFAGVIGSTPMNSKRYLDPKLAGMFGSSNWLSGRSRKTRDLDELLMATILPEWMQMIRNGVVGKVRLPRETELCPLYMQLKYYVENPRKPVSWSLAFGVHAMLTAILDVDQENQSLMKISKSMFDVFFAQNVNAVKLSQKDGSSNMFNLDSWKHNLCMVSFLESFGLDVFKEQAMWNPLCAGTTLSIISFFGNLEIGSAVIDCQAQLRIVMYLYHGLLINNIIRPDDMPFLDILYNAFKECKAIWCGGLPKRGELVQRFWISFGLGLKESKKMAETAEAFARADGKMSSKSMSDEMQMCRGRNIKPIEPRELATCFRRICERDFDGIVDKYHTPEQRKNSQGSELYLFAVRTNDTLDNLDKELQLLSVNFFSSAYYLEQFVCSIGRVLQWEGILKSFKRTGCDMRQGFAILFAQHVLGTLDFARDPVNREILEGFPIGLVTSSFMNQFFNRIPVGNILWFQAMLSDEGSVQVSTFPYAR